MPELRADFKKLSQAEFCDEFIKIGRVDREVIVKEEY
jgi:hypothetical protein